MSEWGMAQRKDASLTDAYDRAQNPQEHEYAVKEGILYQAIDGNYVPLAPQELRFKLIQQFHGTPAQGHWGPEKTYLNMKKHVYWPTMRQNIFQFVERCDLCQRYKRNYNRVPLQRQSIPSRPFETVTMDIVGPVTRSNFGERYILVIQDLLTRWVELAPLKTTDASSVIRKLEGYWICRYGMPERLLTDRAAIFTGKEMAEFCRFYGTEKIHTTAYRP
jgi:transposase InsO family protein